MADKPIQIPDFDKQLERILKKYADDADKEVKAAAKAAARAAAQEIKRDSPVGDSTKHYKDGWQTKDVSTRLAAGYVVHNKSKYQIAHLLEKGHAKRGGGRTSPIRHILPAEERAIKKLEKAVVKIYEKG